MLGHSSSLDVKKKVPLTSPKCPFVNEVRGVLFNSERNAEYVFLNMQNPFISFLCFLFQVIPILKLLYSAEEQNSHHIYMALIVLLILSQDENFNKSVHEVVRRSFEGELCSRFYVGNLGGVN